MFQQLFLQRLPSSVQAILAPNVPSSNAQMLTETADLILEYYQPPVTANVASRSTTAHIIEDVMKRLRDLTLEVSQLLASRVSRPLNNEPVHASSSSSYSSSSSSSYSSSSSSSSSASSIGGSSIIYCVGRSVLLIKLSYANPVCLIAS
ncbi:hypothetical protein SprV_0200787500 [Sparganum proliferum]